MNRSRRDVLRAAGAAAGATALSWAPLPRAVAAQAAPAPPRRRALRLAHLTDVHVQPELGAGEGLTACLRHAQSRKDPPQLVLNGGDAVMDVFGADAGRARVLADLWRHVWKTECSLPVEHCVGNHDVWGWDRKDSKTTGAEPGWGKRWALDLLGLDRPYRSFDRAGWHFIVLDSVHRSDKDGEYVARLDDEQFQWLEADLRATRATTPALILSHIPIISVAAMMYGEQEKSGEWVVPASWMHIDARRLKDLFARHANVKLCLSGHIHTCDQVKYGGVTYVCGGAVCGDWWKGPIEGFSEGYSLVDLYADGTFDVQYLTYGWTARS